MLQVAVPWAELPLLCGSSQTLTDLLSLCVALQKCQPRFVGKGQVLINTDTDTCLLLLLLLPSS